MKSVNLIFHENASCWVFFKCAIMFASKIWFKMAHKIFCLKILVGPPPCGLNQVGTEQIVGMLCVSCYTLLRVNMAC